MIRQRLVLSGRWVQTLLSKIGHIIAALNTLTVIAMTPAGAADDLNTMQFDLVPPPLPIQVFGNAWTIYAHGIIDDGAPKRLDNLIKKNSIPNRSSIYLASPGGSLFQGMKLGKLIREHGLYTYIGEKNDAPLSPAKPSVCLSACALTFLGGTFDTPLPEAVMAYIVSTQLRTPI